MALAVASPATETVSDPWWLIEVGPAARSLEIGYEFGGCTGPGTPRAVQSRLTVAVSVLSQEALVGVCPAIAAIGHLSVALSAPLGGRHLKGGTAGNGMTGPFLPGTGQVGGTLAVPRLVGLAPSDASFLLAGLQLRASMHVIGREHGLPRVISQSPAPDSPIPGDRLVRVTVAR